LTPLVNYLVKISGYNGVQHDGPFSQKSVE
jgi:hypothetical protein